MKHVLSTCFDDGHMFALNHLFGSFSNDDGKFKTDGYFRGF